MQCLAKEKCVYDCSLLLAGRLCDVAAVSLPACQAVPASGYGEKTPLECQSRYPCNFMISCYDRYVCSLQT